MRKTLVSLFIVALFAACGGPGSGDKPTANQSSTTEVSVSNSKKIIAHIGVEGMTCAVGCAKAIEDNLKGLSGVEMASVNFDDKQARIEFSSDQMTKEELVSVITNTNGGGLYQVTTVELEEFVQSEIEGSDSEPSSHVPASDEIDVSVASVGKELVAKKLDINFPSIFTALLDLY